MVVAEGFLSIVRVPGKSLVMLAVQNVVRGPTDFLTSLSLWQLVLGGCILLLAGSALFFWTQKVYTMVVGARRKEESH